MRAGVGRQRQWDLRASPRLLPRAVASTYPATWTYVQAAVTGAESRGYPNDISYKVAPAGFIVRPSGWSWRRVPDGGWDSRRPTSDQQLDHASQEDQPLSHDVL